MLKEGFSYLETTLEGISVQERRDLAVTLVGHVLEKMVERKTIQETARFDLHLNSHWAKDPIKPDYRIVYRGKTIYLYVTTDQESCNALQEFTKGNAAIFIFHQEKVLAPTVIGVLIKDKLASAHTTRKNIWYASNDGFLD